MRSAGANVQRRNAPSQNSSRNWGFALNPEVCLQVEDRLDERRRSIDHRQRSTSLWRDEHRACDAAGVKVANTNLARHNCRGQRSRRLAAQVAARRRVEQMGESRCRVRRATGHRGGGMMHLRHRDRRMMHMGHRGMALRRMTGCRKHGQSTLRPQADAQRQYQRQDSPHCTLGTHEYCILASRRTARQ